MKFLSDEMISGLAPAETASFPSPVPTQIVSSDEYPPIPQTAQQREVEARLIEMSDRLARHQGMSRRRAPDGARPRLFVAMNQVFGPLFGASEAEAATPELANQLAAAQSGQFVIDGQHFQLFRRWTPPSPAFVKGREAVGQWG